MAKHAGGRPPIIDETILAKLKSVYLKDATDEQACLEAGISTSALYDYQNAHPEFVEQKKLWKENIKYKAKLNLVNAIDEGDKDTSKWYSERRAKEEFSVRNELTGKDGGQLFDLTTVLNELDTRKQHQAGSEVEKESD